MASSTYRCRRDGGREVSGARDAAIERLAAAVLAIVVSATLFQLVEDERLRAAATTQDDRRPDPR